MSVSTDNNISIKDYNEISKYKYLEIKFGKMWHLKTNTVEALGRIKKGTDKHIKKIPDSLSIYEIQKIALYGTAYLFRKVLKL